MKIRNTRVILSLVDRKKSKSITYLILERILEEKFR